MTRVLAENWDLWGGWQLEKVMRANECVKKVCWYWRNQFLGTYSEER